MSESKHTPGPWQLDDDGTISDLLAALQSIADHDPDTCNGICAADCVDHMRETARAAIAKATGTGDRDND